MNKDHIHCLLSWRSIQKTDCVETTETQKERERERERERHTHTHTHTHTYTHTHSHTETWGCSYGACSAYSAYQVSEPSGIAAYLCNIVLRYVLSSRDGVFMDRRWFWALLFYIFRGFPYRSTHPFLYLLRLFTYQGVCRDGDGGWTGESAAPRAASSPPSPADVKTGVSATAADATSGSQSSRITVSR